MLDVAQTGIGLLPVMEPLTITSLHLPELLHVQFLTFLSVLSVPGLQELGVARVLSDRCVLLPI